MVASVNSRNVNVFVCHGPGSIGGEVPDVLRSGPGGSTPSRTGLVGSGLAATAVLGCAFLGLDVLRFLLDPKSLSPSLAQAQRRTRRWLLDPLRPVTHWRPGCGFPCHRRELVPG